MLVSMADNAPTNFSMIFTGGAAPLLHVTALWLLLHLFKLRMMMMLLLLVVINNYNNLIKISMREHKYCANNCNEELDAQLISYFSLAIFFSCGGVTGAVLPCHMN